MAFTVPVFNITVNIWHAGNAPPDPPDLSPLAQLYIPSRGLLDIQPGEDELWQPPIYLRVAVGTDLRHQDIVEAAAGDGWFYRTRWVERMHRGFPNEYFVGILEQTSGPPGPPGDGGLMLEDGDYMLLEDGFFISLE